MKRVSEMTLRELENLILDEFGIPLSSDMLLTIKESAIKGCLRWTPDYLFLTDRNIFIFKRPDEIDNDTPYIDVMRVLLTPQRPRQTLQGLGGMAYVSGAEVVIFYNREDDDFGYCVVGVDERGNAFETDDVTGFSTLEEALEHALENADI